MDILPNSRWVSDRQLCSGLFFLSETFTSSLCVYSGTMFGFTLLLHEHFGNIMQYLRQRLRTFTFLCTKTRTDVYMKSIRFIWCVYIYIHTEIDYMLMFMHTYLYKAKVLNEQVKMLLATKVEFNYCNIHPSKNGVKSTRCAPPEDSSAHPMAAVCARWDLPCRCSCPSPSNIWELL